MRSGACTVQQTLTTEAASVLKHSLSLARRRGHAQVTPLHVAATLLSSRTSHLRRACLKSQPQQHQPQAAASSHPLQCRALELCINVALNRLQTPPGPLIHAQPSLSNALIAALKRAQAHQRRGCIEQQQQQPLLTIKVELEQLIISILDDPTVSRVMREAGFSSTAVKKNIEGSSSSSVFQCHTNSGGWVFSSPCSPSPPETHRDIINPTTFRQSHLFSFPSDHPTPVFFSPQKRASSSCVLDSTFVKEDIKLVLEVLLGKKKKNTVVVGDSVSITEGLVGELMGKVERGEVPAELKQTQFIKFQFAPVCLRFMKKEDVEMNISELRRRVDSLGQTGAIIYTGDLKWTVEENGATGGASSDGCYSPVDHLVTEIGRLLSDYGSSGSRVWLMATASYQTYMRCQMRQPPLEVQWVLQAVSVPSGGLGLSLQASSNNNESQITFCQSPSEVLESKPFIISYSKEEQEKIACCADCFSNYEKEAQLLKSGHTNLLPPWLHPQGTNTNQKDELIELKKKWNRLCFSLNHHHQARNGQGQDHVVSTMCNQCPSGKNQPQASTHHSWPTQNTFFPSFNTISFTDSAARPNHTSNGIPKFRRQNSCTIAFNFSDGPQKQQLSSDSLEKYTEGKEVKNSLSLGTCFVSAPGKLEKGTGDFCRLLKENVPWQSAIVPSIAEALTKSKSEKKDTWLLIQGNDLIGKRRLALTIAESVMGSLDSLLCLNMNKIDNVVTTPYYEKLERALKSKASLLVLVENVDLADNRFLKFLSDGFETGKFGDSSQRERPIGQAMFLLCKGESLDHEDRMMNHGSVVSMVLNVTEEEIITCYRSPGIDNKKRKADWEISETMKAPKFSAGEDISQLVPVANGSLKRNLYRQSSFKTLDLNVKANEDEDEDDESVDKTGEFSSPISSDLTLETSCGPNGFLDSIRNRFVFLREVAQEREMTEYVSCKIRRGFEEFFGDQKAVGFSIEERLLEEVVHGLGSFLNSQFEKWVKEVFQTSLEIVKLKHSGKGGIEVKLCFGGKSDRILEDGFMGTYLPNNIHSRFL